MIIAVITTDREIFKNFLIQENLTFKDARQICRKSDLDNTVYDFKVDLDPKSNVTDYVRSRIITKEIENE
jgi:hypothetical protein